MKQTVVFDFDGVIHSYTSGWKGKTIILDPPVPGIREAIRDIHAAGYEVVIVSTRCATAEGTDAIKNWLKMYDITVDRVCKEKPPAIVYIDDRAICFDGHSETLLEKISNFKPWNKVEVATNMCKYCSGVCYTNKPFKVTTQLGKQVEVPFNFCPVCGSDLRRIMN